MEAKTAKQIIDEEALKLFPETYTGSISECIVTAMERYANQQTASLQQEIKRLRKVLNQVRCLQILTPECEQLITNALNQAS